MSDPTTPAKGLTLSDVEGDDGVWGELLNADLALIDSALGGTASISISGTVVLTDSQIENTGFSFIGTLSAPAEIIWPSFSGLAVIRNDTGGGQSILCQITAGTPITVANGETVALWSDGTNFYRLAQAGGGIGQTGSGQVVLTNTPTISSPTIITPTFVGAASGSGTIPNSVLANSSITIAGHMVSLGGSQTIAASDLTNGTMGTGAVVLATSPTIAGTFSLSGGNPWVSPEAFGAVGDGTKDDTTAFNDAISFLGTTFGGGELRLGPKEYALHSGITINYPITIQGVNNKVSILTADGHDVIVLILNAANIALKDLWVIGKGTQFDTFGATNGCIFITPEGDQCSLTNVITWFGNYGATVSAADVYFLNCGFTWAYGNCQVLDAAGMWFERCIFDQPLPTGVYPTFSSSIPAWTNSITVNANQIYSLNGYYIQCTNAVSGMTASTGSGPTLQNYGVPITETADGGSATWLLVGSAALSGLQINGAAAETRLSKCDFSGFLNFGLLIGSSTHVAVNHSTFGGVISTGVYIAAGASSVIIDSNELATGSLTTGIGIYSPATSCTLIIANNYIYSPFGTAEWGILLQGSGTTTITGNQILKTAHAAIEVSAGIEQFVITGNIIAAALDGSSIIVDTGSSDYYIIVNNIVTGIAISDGGTGSH